MTSRRARRALAWTAGAALAATASAAGRAQELGDFTIPWNDASPGPVDQSSQNARGSTLLEPLSVGSDAHLYRDGERYRLWGVNLNGWGGCAPSHEESEALAARLAKLGINAVRIHGCDTYYAWPRPLSLIDYRTDSSSDLDPEVLEKVDYFVAELFENGIYVDWNLLVGRRFLPMDSLDAAAPLPVPAIDDTPWPEAPMQVNKHFGYFFQPVREAQKRYARDLLTHENPYTGRTYAADPGVFAVEIVNETGPVHAWKSGYLGQFPSEIQAELTARWNDWLSIEGGYASTDALAEAWGGGASRELLLNIELAEPITPFRLEAMTPSAATAAVETTPEGPALAIQVTSAGTEDWHVQLIQDGLSLTPGESYTFTFRARAEGVASFSYDFGRAVDPWDILQGQFAVPITSEFAEYALSIVAPDLGGDPARVAVMVGLSVGTVWLGDFSVLEGAATLEPGETLEAGTVPWVDPTSGRSWSGAANRDFVGFLRDTERDYLQEMSSFLEDDLGVTGLVMGSHTMVAVPSVQAELDATMVNAYWDIAETDPAAWNIRNESALGSPPGVLALAGASRSAGKPRFITETLHSPPGDFAGEAPLLIAAYSALHDVDGVFLFATSTAPRNESMHATTDFMQHPGVAANALVGARLFRTFDVAPTGQIWTVAMSPDIELETLHLGAQGWNVLNASQRGFPLEALAQGRVELDHSVGAVDSEFPAPAAPGPLVSDTAELSWDSAARSMTIDSARTRAVLGFVQEPRALGGPGVDCTLADAECVVLSPGASRLGFSTLALTLLEGDSFSGEGRALLVASGEVTNTGLTWNADRTSVGFAWGTPPVLVETVPGTVSLPRAAAEVRVFALDARGQRMLEVPVTDGENGASFELGGAPPTVWYEVGLGNAADPAPDPADAFGVCAEYAALEGVVDCHASEAAAIAACSAWIARTTSGICDCSAEREAVLACVAGESASLDCSDLALGIAADGPCLSALVDLDRCTANEAPCSEWERDPWDDLESGDGRVPAASGRGGQWLAYAGPNASIEPNPFQPSPGGALGSAFCAAATVEGDDWAAMQLQIANGAAYDLSVVEGVEFYAKGVGPLDVRVMTANIADSDYYAKTILLGAEWRYYQVRFDDYTFLQNGWGEPADFDPSRVTGLVFEPRWDTPRPYEFAVDEVALIRAPGTTPPGTSGGSSGGGAAGAGGAQGGTSAASGGMRAGGGGGQGGSRGGEPSTTGGEPPSEPEPGSDSGCGCEVPGGGRLSGTAWLVGVLGGAFFLARRRG